MRLTEQNLELAAAVMADPMTAAFIMGSMTLGNAVRILCELGRSPGEIREAVDSCIRFYHVPEEAG